MMQTSQETGILRHSKSYGNVEGVEVEGQPPYDKDQIELARTGKKQVFKVRLDPRHIQIRIFFAKTTVVEELCLHVNAGI